MQTGTMPDGRPNYTGGRVSNEYSYVIWLTNTSEGEQYSLALNLQKPFDNGITASAGYIYGSSTSINDGTSSQATSNWRYLPAVDANDPELADSNFNVEHRFVATVSYAFNITDSIASTVALYYNHQSGRPYSTTYSRDMNGDNQDNDLIYVPASADEIVLFNGTWEQLDNYIQADEGLRRRPRRDRRPQRQRRPVDPHPRLPLRRRLPDHRGPHRADPRHPQPQQPDRQRLGPGQVRRLQRGLADPPPRLRRRHRQADLRAPVHRPRPPLDLRRPPLPLAGQARPPPELLGHTSTIEPRRGPTGPRRSFSRLPVERSAVSCQLSAPPPALSRSRSAYHGCGGCHAHCPRSAARHPRSGREPPPGPRGPGRGGRAAAPSWSASPSSRSSVSTLSAPPPATSGVWPSRSLGPPPRPSPRSRRELGVVVVVNLYERDGDRCFDSSPVIDADGTLLGVTRMVHITDYPCFHEQGYYAPGDTGAPVYRPAPDGSGWRSATTATSRSTCAAWRWTAPSWWWCPRPARWASGRTGCTRPSCGSPRSRTATSRPCATASARGVPRLRRRVVRVRSGRPGPRPRRLAPGRPAAGGPRPLRGRRQSTPAGCSSRIVGPSSTRGGWGEGSGPRSAQPPVAAPRPP